MRAIATDDIDTAIIAELVADGRASLASLAETVGLSPDAVRSRLAKLTDAGLLRLVGVVDPVSLGLNAQASVVLDFRGDVRDLARLAKEHSEITHMMMIMGDVNILCEVTTRDGVALADFVAQTLATADGVHSVEIWSHLATRKWAPFTRSGAQIKPGLWPDQVRTAARPDDVSETPAPAPVSLDDLDMRLLRCLVADPRASYAELAEATQTSSYNLVRRRSQRLFASGVIRATAVFDYIAVGERSVSLVCFRMRGDIDKGLTAVAALPQIDVLTRISGRFTAVGQLVSGDQEEMLDVLDRQLGLIDEVAQVVVYPVVQTEKLASAWVYGGVSTPS